MSNLATLLSLLQPDWSGQSRDWQGAIWLAGSSDSHSVATADAAAVATELDAAAADRRLENLENSKMWILRV